MGNRPEQVTAQPACNQSLSCSNATYIFCPFRLRHQRVLSGLTPERRFRVSRKLAPRNQDGRFTSRFTPLLPKLSGQHLCCKRGGLREKKNLGNEDIVGSPATRSPAQPLGFFAFRKPLQFLLLNYEIKTLHAEIREKQLFGNTEFLLTSASTQRGPPGLH